MARVSLDSNNELIDGKIDLDALVAKKKVDLTLGAELNKADFYGLGLMKNEFTLGL